MPATQEQKDAAAKANANLMSAEQAHQNAVDDAELAKLALDDNKDNSKKGALTKVANDAQDRLDAATADLGKAIDAKAKADKAVSDAGAQPATPEKPAPVEQEGSSNAGEPPPWPEPPAGTIRSEADLKDWVRTEIDRAMEGHSRETREREHP